MNVPVGSMDDGTPCELCGKPAAGFAQVNGKRYCHGDHDSEPTCYMIASRGATPARVSINLDDLAPEARREVLRLFRRPVSSPDTAEGDNRVSPEQREKMIEAVAQRIARRKCQCGHEYVRHDPEDAHCDAPNLMVGQDVLGRCGCRAFHTADPDRTTSEWLAEAAVDALLVEQAGWIEPWFEDDIVEGSAGIDHPELLHVVNAPEGMSSWDGERPAIPWEPVFRVGVLGDTDRSTEPQPTRAREIAHDAT